MLNVWKKVMIDKTIKFKYAALTLTGKCISYSCDDFGRAVYLNVLVNFGICRKVYKVYPCDFINCV